MKKYLQNGWIRVLSCIICAISIVSLAVGILGFVFVTEFRDSEGIYESGYNQVAENYALYAIDMYEQGNVEKLQKSFLEKKISCSIELIVNEAVEGDEIISKTTNLFSIGELDKDQSVVLEVVEGSSVHYRETSLLAVLLGYAHYSDGSDWVEYPIEKVVFDTTRGLFYYQTAAGLYPVEYLNVKSIGEGYYDYKLVEHAGKECYYNGYYNIILDTAQYPNWEWVDINGYAMGLSTQSQYEDIQYGDIIEVWPAGTEWTGEIYSGEYSIWGDRIATPNVGPMNMYQVQISWTPTPHSNSLFSEWRNLSQTLSDFDTYAVPMIFISFIVMVLSFSLVVYSANSDKEKLGFMQKTPVICYSVGVFLILYGIVWGCYGIENWFISDDIGRLSDIVKLTLLVAFVFVWIVLGWFQNIVTRIKCKSFWRTSEVYYGYGLLKKSWKFTEKPVKWFWGIITAPFRAVANGYKRMVRLANENVPLFWSGLAIVFVLAIVEFIFAYNMYWEYACLFVYILLKVIELVVLLIALLHMQRLHEGSKRIATGDLSTPVDTKRMFWKFKEHGENINKVSDGISLAVKERMKSEHFKTELITNVSHDIKTPLTSIINYVDLIKKEDISDEKVVEYVEVLDRQSARLKKLIEDLMEASKASTGNLSVNLEECDLDVLLSQVIGEFEEKLEKNQLQVIVDKPEHPVKMMADGRHMWRVFDNLLNNVCKYSLPGSRVYVSLKQENQEAVIVFKNISKTALNIPSEELMERFVRGDSSRNTEGSGLGLSIAQSLTELMHGNMKLEIDGDLFKVTLQFPTMTI